MNLLQVHNLNVQFHNGQKGQEAVKRLSFEVKPGEIVGIVGESGSGKSTAMHAVLGLLQGKAQIDCDAIILNERDITPPARERPDKKAERTYARKMREIRGNEIAMVFQDPLTYLNPVVKIGRQITETIQAHKNCSRMEAKEQARELLDSVGIPNPGKRMNQYPSELSGGMRQRVVMAIALACEPKLLIADEPTTALDATVQGQLLELLKRRAKETKTAVLLVSHDLGVTAALCSRILVMKDGSLVEEGTAEDIFYEPRHAYTQELIRQALDIQKLHTPLQAGEAIFTAAHISKEFPEEGDYRKRTMTEAVHDVSFTLYKGETYGLVGESGSGKTTLAELVTGLMKPTEGELVFCGDCTKKGARVQMVFQNPYASLNPRMSVFDALEEPLLLHADETPKERKQKVEEMLELVGLRPEDARKYPRAFSGGQRQRIGIARALITEPELLILDEPVSALDVSVQEQILKLLEKIQKEKEISYFFISHDLNVVKCLSSHIGVMYEGCLVETGSTKEIYEDPWHPYTKELLSSILLPDPLKARRRLQKLHGRQQQKHTSRKGCPYVPTCGYAMECCYEERPGSYSFGERSIACFLYAPEHTALRNRSYRMISQI